MKPTRHILANQKGAYFMVSAIVLSVMVGFAALGVELGRWYAIQAEISKSIDGAAFAGAKNVNNPMFPNAAALNTFVVNVAQANFPPNMLGTDGTPTFTSILDDNGKVNVTGNVDSVNNLTTVFHTGAATTNLSAVGSAKLRLAEIALVLDFSGSMDLPDPQPIVDLRDGATVFVNNFQAFQTDHKFALITFASGVTTPFAMAHQFVEPMTGEIAGLIDAKGSTNIEDALAQARSLQWSPDQDLLPANERTRQVVILFSDGVPTAFRAGFMKEGVSYDASVTSGPILKEANAYNQSITKAWPSGIGTGATGTEFSNQCGSGSQYKSVKWDIFADTTYGLNSSVYPPFNGAGINDCFTKHELRSYVDAVSIQKALDNAEALKGDGIEVYTIGLGTADAEMMQTMATDAEHAFFATSSSELQGIFQEIANRLKLILVS